MSKLTTKTIFATLCLAILAGCAGGSGASRSAAASAPDLPAVDEKYAPAVFPGAITTATVPMILDPAAVPPAPDSDVNNATLAGVDSNNNGIRDDVERWIASEFDSPQERAVVAQIAKSMQATAYWKAGKMTLMETDRLEGASNTCAIYVHPDNISTNPAAGSNRFKKIIAKTFNTASRVKLLWDYSAEYAGKIVPHPSELGITEQNACELILEGD